MTDELIVRLAIEEELAEVSALEGLSGLPYWGEEAYRKQLASSGGILLIARKGAAGLLGFAHGRVIEDEMEVLSIAVAEEFRNQGLGRSLLAELERRAALAGAAKAFLEVRVSNEGALGLYRKCGYLAAGRRPSYYHDPVEDAVIMVRALV